MADVLKKFGLRAVFFAAVSLLAAVYPLYKTLSYEFPISNPSVFRFEMAGLDPYDAFRGRYLAISPRIDTVVIKDANFSNKRYVYASIGRNKDGFAQVTGLYAEKPDTVSLKIRTPYPDRHAKGLKDGEAAYAAELPFKRFFMNEREARKAEEIMNRMIRRGAKLAIVIKIYSDGNYSAEDIEIEGRSIREYFAE